eukprot:TRINITY_DN914_c0_g1_i1.p1 TRINITY_DN914_c0_g1~~TRINITY_DN914_c0_g1_i1.p1  ORF type:complete len:338 (+),score=94.03 TRINITY_DN914_c0_g1_i1:352-1365(+)
MNAKTNIKRKDGCSALFIAAKYGNFEIVKKLIDSGADSNILNNQNQTPLMIACKHNHFEVVKILTPCTDVEKVDNDNQNCLHYACIGGNNEIVQYLLNRNVSMIENVNGDFPIDLASFHHHSRLFQMLKNHTLPRYIEKHPEKTSTLFEALNNNEYLLIKECLRRGTSIDIVDDKRRSLLYHACNMRYTRLFNYLVFHSNINVHLCDIHGYNALYISCMRGHVRFVRILLGLQVDVNHVAKDGSTALFIACKKGHFIVVQMLLHQNANIHLYTNDSNTCLHKAAEFGHLEIVKLLLEIGADPFASNDKDETPLNLALKRNNASIARLLKEAMINSAI